MGWRWGSNGTPGSTNSDPLRDLDPSLRDFLEKESPTKYKPAPAPTPPTPSEQSAPPSSATSTTTESSTAKVPPESLYQDGRYAHLWSTYRPLSVVEAESKSDQEKLADIFDGYKERKANIGRAALENCALEQIALSDCYETGGVKAKMTMCRKENRAFERCYTMQARFLKALGYLSTYERPASVDEEIQMHADTLYHRMLAQEHAVAAAKAANEPIPTFPPILGSKTKSLPAASTSLPITDPRTTTKVEKDLPPLSPHVASILAPEAAKTLRERMKDMTPTERQIEEQSVIREGEAANQLGQHIGEMMDARRRRRKEGNATAGDMISGWFGW